MATLINLFEEFLRNIEPDRNAVLYAQEAHKPVRDYLAVDSSINGYVDSTFLYGSYKRHTAVGDIKDVDIVLVTTFSPDNPQHSPQRVLKLLKAALTRFYDDADATEYQRRSIRVDDPLPNKPNVKLTLDIIPAIAPEGPESHLLVPDRELARWIKSHPKSHIAYSSRLNAETVSGGRFVPLAKIMKWWWKHQAGIYQPNVQRPKPKGFWIECLTGLIVQELLEEGLNVSSTSYADLFVAVLTRIASKYGVSTQPPVLADPGLPDQAIETSMTAPEFSKFMATVQNSLYVAQNALAYQGPAASLSWREIYGSAFPVITAQKSALQESDYDTIHLASTSQEQSLSSHYGVTERLSYHICLRCTAARKGFRSVAVSNGEPIEKGYELTFQICGLNSIKDRHTIYWKVKNSGREAAAAQQLRGEITSDCGKAEKHEVTRYGGVHYVECYVVNHQRECVAKARHYVVIP